MTVFPPQVAKLIPRLASEHDGEVVATARAIERILKSAGLDWHSLAKQVDTQDFIYSADDLSPSPAPPRQPSEPPTPKPARKVREPGWSDLKRLEQLAWCVVLLRRPSLDSKARCLVQDVHDKLYAGQNFYLAPRHKRMMTGLIRMAQADGMAA